MAMLHEVIDDQFVSDVEDEIGMGNGGWDFVDAKELCKAVILIYLQRKIEEENGKEE